MSETTSTSKLLVMALVSKANEKDMRLTGAGAKAGIPEDTVKNWIRGNAAPNDAELAKVCEVLECPVSEIKKWVAKRAETDQSTEKEQPVATTAKAENSTPTNKTKDNAKENVKVDTNKEKTSTKQTKENKAGTAAATKDFMNAPEKKTEETPATEKPKRVRVKKDTTSAPENTTKTPAKTEKTTLFNEETTQYIRKTVGLKKTDTVDKDAIVKTFETASATVSEKLQELARLEREVTAALFESIEAAKVDPRLQALMAAAENASDEGIELALTILKKFPK